MSKQTDARIIGSPSLFRRLAAMFYDSWLVLACLLVSSALVIVLRISVEGLDSMPQGQIAITGHWRWLTFGLSVSVCWLFFCYFWTKSGQTLGMQTWRIRIDAENQQRLTWAQANKRFFCACLSFAMLGGGYLFCLFNKRNRSLHDILSKTDAVLLEKRKGKH